MAQLTLTEIEKLMIEFYIPEFHDMSPVEQAALLQMLRADTRRPQVESESRSKNEG
jgi:hypothetical protein